MEKKKDLLLLSVKESALMLQILRGARNETVEKKWLSSHQQDQA